ncbi:MAG: thiamine-phosphate kinase [Pyrinomonadaceae bacterium]
MKTEFGFLGELREKYNLEKIGDDCAVLPKDARSDQVITADLLIEDIDFRLEWTRAEFIGHKALAVSLSDVAAMGADPVWSMVSIGVPEKIWRTDFVENFYRGWLKLAENYGVELVGGDVSKTPDKIVIDSIVGGEVEKGKAVLRSGAKPGDLIFVTGPLGGAAAGLQLLERGVRLERAAAWQSHLILKQLAPYPILKNKKRTEFLPATCPGDRATAMIDISDGLSSDLGHLCRASGVGAKIDAEKIPLDRKLKGLTGDFSEQLDLALNGGEDFQLLYTSDPKNFSKKISPGFGPIGEVTENLGKIELIIAGKSVNLEAGGYRHF